MSLQKGVRRTVARNLGTLPSHISFIHAKEVAEGDIYG